MLKIVFAALMAVLAVPAFAQELAVPEGGFVVSENLSLLPPAVQETRDALMAAARTGDIKQLGKIIAAQPAPVTVSFGDSEDPIAYLKGESGDGNGVEILAILANLLDAPYAAMDGGDGDVLYIWPYFAAMEDLRVLTDEQLVDAYRILGYRGFEDQREVGGWLYWRAYINHDGALQAFVAGD